MTDLQTTVLGAGAWGSALACTAARAGHAVTLWGRSTQTIEEINTARTNAAYLGDLKIEDRIVGTSDLDHAVGGADLILLATPAQSLAEMLPRLVGIISPTAMLVCCAKGIDRKSGLLPHQLAANALPDNLIASLSGPSFAADVVRGLPTAVTIAAADIETAGKLAALLSTDRFRCYSSDDLAGVEYGGALKNVLALAVGAARAMELGASAEAALIARGFAELQRLATSLGARRETVTGLSGLGDLVLTCSSPQSRNFAYGMAIGSGDNLEGLKLAEGVFTASIASKIAAEAGIETPITDAVTAVLDKQLTAGEAMDQLLLRPLKRENS